MNQSFIASRISALANCAGLPDDLFSRPQALLGTDEYFRLWESIEALGGDPTIGLRIGSAQSVEAFDPPIFAALCSRNLNEALPKPSGRRRTTEPPVTEIVQCGEPTSV